MKNMKFRIEWGYWHGYFAKQYLPVLDFSGSVSVKGGTLLSQERTIFKMDDWGPQIYSRSYEKLTLPEWESLIHNTISGIRIEAEVDENSVIVIDTKIKRAEFNVGELIKKRHLVINAGEKYSYSIIHAEIDDEVTYWFTPEVKENQTLISYPAFLKDNEPASLFNVTGCMIPCGKNAEADFAYSKMTSEDDSSKVSARLRIRFLLCASESEEKMIRAIARFKVLINGKEVWQNRKFGMWHDGCDQLLEEVWADIDSDMLHDGRNTVEVINQDNEANVLLQSLMIEQNINSHLEAVSCPKWALVGEPFSITIKSNHPSTLIKLQYDSDIFAYTINGTDEETYPRLKTPGTLTVHEEDKHLLSIGEGENEFFFVAKKPVKNAKIEFIDEWRNISSIAIIPEVWALDNEAVPAKAGFEVRTGTPYEYIDIIKDAYRAQLGNFAVFRDYHNLPNDPSTLWDAAEYCRKHRIYTDAICVQEQTTIARASGEFCQSLGSHEFTGTFYGRFKPQNIASSLRDSEHMAVDQLSLSCENYRYKDVPVATGDASGGSRYAYMAGFDILRHETFVGHHTLILTGARGCARAFYKNNWGVHVASQHNAHPELENGIRRFWLGMFMPWVYGSSFAFEEDTLYQLFKYIRNTGEDYMTKAKYEVTKEYYKYVSTHPREGESQVDIAILQGRYAPPFTGISTANDGKDNPYSNENYPVFGHTGCEAWEWGFRQPEKGFHLMELLAPGIFLTPLYQNKEKVRKFFSGSPHGEFDQLPVEASNEVFSKYKFIALLNWHTMEYTIKGEVQRSIDIPNDYCKFIEYAKQGGTLFMALPQLTTRADRELLIEMDNLKLYQNGDVSELCGVKIHGKTDTEFSGDVKINGQFDSFLYDDNFSFESNRMPNSSPDEDGECMLADITLCGAEAVLIDSNTGLPLLVRNKIGKGCVYLLTAYAYPGHEALKDTVPKILSAIIESVKKTRQIEVTGETDELYWSNWRKDKNSGRVYLLNTDWTVPENEITAEVSNRGISLSCSVKEGKMTQVIYFKGGLISSASSDDYISVPEETESGYSFDVQCYDGTNITLVADANYRVIIDGVEHVNYKRDKENSFKIKALDDTMLHNILLVRD